LLFRWCGKQHSMLYSDNRLEYKAKLSFCPPWQKKLISNKLSPTVVLLQMFPFSTALFTDIGLRKSKILFLIQWGVFEPPEALPIYTLSKLHFLIHEIYLANHLSFLELLDCGIHYHPLLPLSPPISHLLNLTSTNLTLSPFLLKLPIIVSVFPWSGLCYRPYGLSLTLLTKNRAVF